MLRDKSEIKRDTMNVTNIGIGNLGLRFWSIAWEIHQEFTSLDSLFAVSIRERTLIEHLLVADSITQFPAYKSGCTHSRLLSMLTYKFTICQCL